MRAIETALLLLLMIVGASAQGRQCAPIGAFERVIEGQYGEELLAVGTVDKRTVRIYVDPISRSWTIISVDGRGIACPIASGEDFDMAKLPPAGEGL